MNKQELVHLHGLLAQVHDYYEQESGETVNLNNYADLGVQPTSIHMSKTDHKVALFALAGDITSAMEGVEEDPVDLLEEGYQDVSRDLFEVYEEFKRVAHSNCYTYGGGIGEDWGVSISGDLDETVTEVLGSDPRERIEQMDRAGLGEIKAEEQIFGASEDRFYFKV